MAIQVKRTIKQALWRSITTVLGDTKGLVVLPTLTGPARGLRFELDLNEFIGPAYFLGRYETNVARAIAETCQKGWVVWDCGTHLGYYTNLFARLVGPSGKVVAFEPDPRNIQKTKDNLERNHFSNVEFVQAAIAGATGEIDFTISNDTNSHIAGAYIGLDYEDYSTRERHDDSIRVRCLSLDDAYSSDSIPKPNIIKIDIEGAELQALPSAYNLARQLKPLIILELHNPECDAAAWKFSQDVGYALRSLDTGETIKSSQGVTGTVLCSPQN
jgi:FkbM family methyltransferase